MDVDLKVETEVSYRVGTRVFKDEDLAKDYLELLKLELKDAYVAYEDDKGKPLLISIDKRDLEYIEKQVGSSIILKNLQGEDVRYKVLEVNHFDSTKELQLFFDKYNNQ